MSTIFDYSESHLEVALRTAGLAEGDTVFVHSGIGFLGKLQDCQSAADMNRVLAEALRRVVGNGGTIIVPTYSYSFCNKQNYDPHTTPSTIGSFAEYFRSLPQVVRSRDPIFSVACIGPQASFLTHDLPLTCFGDDSIYDRLTQIHSKICTIGLDLSYATFRHHIEEICKVPFRYVKSFSGQVLRNGNWEDESWAYFVRVLGPCGFPNAKQMAMDLVNEGISKTSVVGRGKVFCIDTSEFKGYLTGRLLSDPWYTAAGPPQDCTHLRT